MPKRIVEQVAGVQAGPEIVSVPEWEERFPWLRAGFSARSGGTSSAYGTGEQNLGWTKEDDPAAVAANREAFVRSVAEGAPMSLVTVGQVHGGVVRDLEGEAEPFMTVEGKARLEGDGLISRRAGRLLAILTADCVPVLVADTRLRAVGAFHAGWRGTLARIVEHGVLSMGERYGSRPEDLVAAIGPCIAACCFEVGAEVREAFSAKSGEEASLFVAADSAGTKYRMDLVEANRRQLEGTGVRPASIWAARACTACARTGEGRRRFFSHRSERGTTGRMLSAVGVVV